MRGEAKAKAKAEREEGGRCERVGVRAGVINGNTEERKRQNRRTKKKKKWATIAHIARLSKGKL